jgi:uncharacterized protein
MNAFVIDAFELCRNRGRLEGEFQVAKLPRLAEESVNGAGTVRWSLQGDTDQRGYPRMTLSVVGSVHLMCQRCLAPFEFNISSDASLALARDEASADEMDALLADESTEVIVGSREFNIAELVEDEVLLAIPSAPKHEACAIQAVPDGEPAQKVSPFAVLKGLKQ